MGKLFTLQRLLSWDELETQRGIVAETEMGPVGD